MVVACFCNFVGASAIACCEFCINFFLAILDPTGITRFDSRNGVGIIGPWSRMYFDNPSCELPNPIQAAQHAQWRAIEPIIPIN
jgi:hypothetical protein